MTHRPLEHTVVAITGASSGIGEAAAIALADLGASVALIARRKDRLETLAANLRNRGAGVVTLPADITDAGTARAAIDRAASEFGRLDTLINNAGLMLLGQIADAEFHDWERMLDVNVRAVMRCTHAALPYLLQAAEHEPRRVADIINVSSVAGRIARKGSGVYNATKFAVNAFSESLRQETAKRHVRVTLIEPGAVQTELASHNRPSVQDMIQQRFENVEHLGASDVAQSIAFAVTRPRRVSINEILIRPTEQEF